MSNRDREIVEDYKTLFSSMFSTPHVHTLEGEWYLVKYPEEPPWVIDLKAPRIEGWSAEPEEELTVDSLVEKGYTLTPLIIHKVDTHYTR